VIGYYLLPSTGEGPVPQGEHKDALSDRQAGRGRCEAVGSSQFMVRGPRRLSRELRRTMDHGLRTAVTALFLSSRRGTGFRQVVRPSPTGSIRWHEPCGSYRCPLKAPPLQILGTP
jgi:hypothetical protein